MSDQHNNPIEAPSPTTLYSVVHETHYQYQSNVTLSQQVLHMSPRTFHHQDTLSHRIDIAPLPQEVSDRLDYFGNLTQGVTLSTPHQVLLVNAISTIAVHTRHARDRLKQESSWEDLRDRMRSTDAATHFPEAVQFLFESPHIQCNTELAAYAAPSFQPQRPLLEATYDLMERIYRDFEFDNTATTISTPLHEVLRGRRGVCQDFAHLMIGCLRSIGVAARYVSGYILTHPPLGQPRMVGADASHAWVSVYCDEWGWVDFDPTNCRLVNNEHITLGWGRDFSDVTPMRGIVLGGGEQNLVVRVTVSPVG
jgi:transglutaminase-like putative cysteine protease